MPLAARDLFKSFVSQGIRVPVLSGVSLEVARGESVALTGESGSGKSTLLHILAGLEPADSGQVLLDGTDTSTLDDAARASIRRRRIGIVFQQFNLIPSLDVRSNIAFQAQLAGVATSERIHMLAERLGLSEQIGRYPEELSGGQQQRVAIARALAVRPEIVLADEPTGNLDESTGDTVLDLMLELIREENASLVMVTHSGRLARRLDRTLLLSHGRLS